MERKEIKLADKISEKKIIEIVKDALGTETIIDMDSSSSNVPEWDSLGHLTILSALDEQLGDVYQENDEVASANSVQLLVEAVNKG